MTDFWYHWSPLERRKQIQRYGLLPNRYATDRAWKPPYVCLAASPSLAWSLSGEMPRGSQIATWDLWQVSVEEQSGYEKIFFDNGVVKEIRVYERIYKRNIWLVAQRDAKYF